MAVYGPVVVIFTFSGRNTARILCVTVIFTVTVSRFGNWSKFVGL